MPRTFTAAGHLSLSSGPLHILFKIIFNIILPPLLPPSGFLPSDFPTKTLYLFLFSYIRDPPPPRHSPWSNHVNNNWWLKSLRYLLHNFHLFFCYFLCLRPNRPVYHPVLVYPHTLSFPLVWIINSHTHIQQQTKLNLCTFKPLTYTKVANAKYTQNHKARHHCP